jgi:CRISPR-associated protein Cas1
MTTVYVREQGAVLRKRGERLVVTKEDKELETIHLVDLDQVALVGNIQLTSPAAAVLLERAVDVVFFSPYFKYRGRLVGVGSKHAALRVAQLRVMSDEGALLPVARRIVFGKVTNQRVVLQRQAGVRGDGPAGATLRTAIAGIAAMRAAGAGAGSLDSLRGYEGKAGAYYFGALRALLDPRWEFAGRAYHPPPDPINAALSFGYALLLKDATAAVQLVGLEPYLGFFHAIEYGRPSLALDVMEEFRPLLVDPLVLALVHDGALTPADFVWTGDGQQSVRLGEAGMRLMIEGYERRLETVVRHPVSGDQVSYRRCLELQVRQLAALVQGRAADYVPVVAR